MPELPEAETLVRGLRPLIPGRTIESVEVRHADVLRVEAPAFRAALAGRRVEAVDRRAKNVLLRLGPAKGPDTPGARTGSGSRGEGRITGAPGGAEPAVPLHRPAVLVVNLGMTGALVPLGFPDRPRGKATHPALILELDQGRALVYDDVRRFGCVEILERRAWRARSRSMGPEPLSSTFRARDLHQALLRSRSPLRSWLLDQRRIAGVGNIYANEACFGARIHPARPACRVDEGEARRLHRALRRALRSGLEHGGTTLRDYRNAEGEPGRNQGRLRVYGREGEPCPRCRTPIERIVFGNRSAFLCPRCQS